MYKLHSAQPMENSDKSILKEPKSEWGGTWTEKKLNAFSKYVAAYLTIMKKYSYWKTIYFDGFAGSGDRRSVENSPLYRALHLTESDEKLYKGAAERVLSLPDELSFDYYYFIDTNEISLNKLKINLAEFQKSRINPFQFKPGDCNKWLFDLSEAMHKPKSYFAALVFLDPFGMQIKWESIESLKNTRTDIWILIPTGVIVNRLLDRNGNLEHIEILQSFFGLTEDEIRKEFYRTQLQQTLFGEDEIIRKIDRPIEKIANLYVRRLKTIWKFVTENPLVLKNSKGVPIFHFVFASNNASALKIAKQIIKSI